MHHRSALFSALLCACAAAPTASDPAPSGPDPEAPAAATPPASPAADPPATAVRKTGVLLWATGQPIAGASFDGGVTDAKGTFSYEDGKPVTFRAGADVLGTASGADVLSPYQLAGSPKCDDTPALVALVAKLEALDTDPGPGITIGASAATLPANDVALRAFLTAFDGEAWSEASKDTFNLLTAALRGQGVASDGTSWFFSGTTGLEKTDGSFSKVASNAFAIPLGLAVAGSDHIGDIDVYKGTLYAPVEDKAYKAPKVVLYDPSSLTSGTVYDIPSSLQTQGVPWIAVDGPRGVAYMAEWDPTPALHVFDLATLTYLRDIPLSRTLGRIQGAKVHQGQLYASMDDAKKSIVKIHLASGTVIDLFDFAGADMEEEGIALSPRPDGTLMHTLDVPSGRTSSELRHHRITREPLRWTVCK